MTPRGDALSRIGIEVTQLEAIAKVANAAIDEFGVSPSGSCRDLGRIYALATATAEHAAALVELAEELKESIRQLLLLRS